MNYQPAKLLLPAFNLVYFVLDSFVDINFCILKYKNSCPIFPRILVLNFPGY